MRREVHPKRPKKRSNVIVNEILEAMSHSDANSKNARSEPGKHSTPTPNTHFQSPSSQWKNCNAEGPNSQVINGYQYYGSTTMTDAGARSWESCVAKGDHAITNNGDIILSREEKGESRLRGGNGDWKLNGLDTLGSSHAKTDSDGDVCMERETYH